VTVSMVIAVVFNNIVQTFLKLLKIHSHDRNMAVNKFVKETQFTTNQNDLWHAVKPVKQSVSKGAKFSEGLSWSQQLAHSP
jgi:pyoverdine/dityrosine biosynthesis protein Dit1